MTHPSKCHNCKLLPFINARQIDKKGYCQKMGPIPLINSEFQIFWWMLEFSFWFSIEKISSVQRFTAKKTVILQWWEIGHR
jgi:hypothetical protein